MDRATAPRPFLTRFMELPASPPIPGQYSDDLQLRVYEGTLPKPVISQLQALTDLLSTGAVGGG
jgi:hypothetical protein